MRRLGVILVGIMLLAACNTSPTASPATGSVLVSVTPSLSPTNVIASSVSSSTSTPVGSSPTPTVAIAQGTPLGEVGYKQMIDKQYHSVAQIVGTLTVETGAPDMTNADWVSRMEGMLDSLNSILSVARTTTPPENYQSFHREWVVALQQIADSIPDIETAIRLKVHEAFKLDVDKLTDLWSVDIPRFEQVVEVVPTPGPTPPPPPAPIVIPTPTPSLAQIKQQYRPDVDVRDLYKQLVKYQGWKLFYQGTVLTIQADDSGTLVQLEVPYDSSLLDYKVIDVFYGPSVSTDGIFEDTHAAIWGRPTQMYTITNALGGQVDQPLLIGDFIEKQ